MSDRNEPIAIEGTVEHVTDKAILFDMEDGSDPVWIPKSLVDDGGDVEHDCEVGDSGVLYVPRWFAEKEGLE